MPTPFSELEPHFAAAALRGWRYFQTSFAEDGVSCVHCHLQHEEIRLWAGAYPKVQVFDGTPYEVKSLRRVVREAMKKHTDLPVLRNEGIIDDLVAYIYWWGDGTVIKPGYSQPFSPPAGDLDHLETAAARGSSLFQRDELGPCRQCHPGKGKRGRGALERAAAGFPRYVSAAMRVMDMQQYLARHLQGLGRGRYAPDAATLTDLSAYLAQRAAGRILLPGRSRYDGGVPCVP